jgi:hypothetical protein
MAVHKPKKKDWFWTCDVIVYLRNKSWKPEFVFSFNMDWQILVFYQNTFEDQGGSMT